MRAKFGPERVFKQPYGTPPAGQFALDVPEDLHWDRCREQFASKFTSDIVGFYFSHEPNQAENVAGFLLKTEIVLDLANMKSPWPVSTYCKTNKDTITWVSPSLFWKVCEAKRSLLTILLRCGMRYDPDVDNYESALFGNENEQPLDAQEYAKNTHLAVKRFLFGFTKYVKQSADEFQKNDNGLVKNGWVAIFQPKDQHGVRNSLVLPDGEEPIHSVIGVDSLWA